MIVERLKYTQQRENGIVTSEWIGIEVKMDGTSESEVVVFDKVKEIVENLHKRSNPAMMAAPSLPIIPSERIPTENNEDFIMVKQLIEASDSYEDAEKHLVLNGFKFNAELKRIVNSKPKKQ